MFLFILAVVFFVFAVIVITENNRIIKDIKKMSKNSIGFHDYNYKKHASHDSSIYELKSNLEKVEKQLTRLEAKLCKTECNLSDSMIAIGDLRGSTDKAHTKKAKKPLKK